MSYSDYLENRKSAFSNITESIKKETKKNRNNDDDIWKPSMGKDGTGYAVIRFLPGKDVNKTPWVRVYDHGFQGPQGKWYIEKSLTSVGEQDPVSEYNSMLWNTGIESNKDIARKQKRRTNYYSNVLIIKDPANPGNEGQVKTYRFGQKIFDKLMGAMQPEFADETPINPFDLFEGANFRVKLKMVAGYWNYDASDFENPSALSEEPSKLESVFEAQADVHILIDPSSFGTFDELKGKLDMVLGIDSKPQAQVPAQQAPSSTQSTFSPPTAETSSSESEFSSVFKQPAESETVAGATETDELEDYFKNLAQD